jgi:dsDNA-specific endonuclease/ATPase MutS2
LPSQSGPKHIFKAAREQLISQRRKDYAGALKNGLPDISAASQESVKLQSQIDEYQQAIEKLEQKKIILAKMKMHYETISKEDDVLNKQVNHLKTNIQVKSTTILSQQSMPKNLKYDEAGPIANRLRNSTEGSQHKQKASTQQLLKKGQRSWPNRPTKIICKLDFRVLMYSNKKCLLIIVKK